MIVVLVKEESGTVYSTTSFNEKLEKEIKSKPEDNSLLMKHLGKEFEKKNNDPIAQIALLSQVQGTLGVVADLSNDMMNELAKLGIDTVPVNL